MQKSKLVLIKTYNVANFDELGDQGKGISSIFDRIIYDLEFLFLNDWDKAKIDKYLSIFSIQNKNLYTIDCSINNLLFNGEPVTSIKNIDEFSPDKREEFISLLNSYSSEISNQVKNYKKKNENPDVKNIARFFYNTSYHDNFGPVLKYPSPSYIYIINDKYPVITMWGYKITETFKQDINLQKNTYEQQEQLVSNNIEYETQKSNLHEEVLASDTKDFNENNSSKFKSTIPNDSNTDNNSTSSLHDKKVDNSNLHKETKDKTSKIETNATKNEQEKIHAENLNEINSQDLNNSLDNIENHKTCNRIFPFFHKIFDKSNAHKENNTIDEASKNSNSSISSNNLNNKKNIDSDEDLNSQISNSEDLGDTQNNLNSDDKLITETPKTQTNYMRNNDNSSKDLLNEFDKAFDTNEELQKGKQDSDSENEILTNDSEGNQKKLNEYSNLDENNNDSPKLEKSIKNNVRDKLNDTETNNENSQEKDFSDSKNSSQKQTNNDKKNFEKTSITEKEIIKKESTEPWMKWAFLLLLIILLLILLFAILNYFKPSREQIIYQPLPVTITTMPTYPVQQVQPVPVVVANKEVNNTVNDNDTKQDELTSNNEKQNSSSVPDTDNSVTTEKQNPSNETDSELTSNEEPSDQEIINDQPKQKANLTKDNKKSKDSKNDQKQKNVAQQEDTTPKKANNTITASPKNTECNYSGVDYTVIDNDKEEYSTYKLSLSKIENGNDVKINVYDCETGKKFCTLNGQKNKLSNNKTELIMNNRSIGCSELNLRKIICQQDSNKKEFCKTFLTPNGEPIYFSSHE